MHPIIKSVSLYLLKIKVSVEERKRYERKRFIFVDIFSLSGYTVTKMQVSKDARQMVTCCVLSESVQCDGF